MNKLLQGSVPFAGVANMLLGLLLVQTDPAGWGRFAVFNVAAFVVCVYVLRLATRERVSSSQTGIVATSAFIVFGGMLFARWAHTSGLPWWIYYGAPALTTFLGPPAVLRMKGVETARYITMAIFMAPAIHVVFSFFIGWHEYMPFFYVPSLWDLVRGMRH